MFLIVQIHFSTLFVMSTNIVTATIKNILNFRNCDICIQFFEHMRIYNYLQAEKTLSKRNSGSQNFDTEFRLKDTVCPIKRSPESGVPYREIEREFN